MPIRTAEAEWSGDRDGCCHLHPRGDTRDGAFDYRSRMEAGSGTSPEQMLGAAQAGCLSMALAARLIQAGFQPERVKTTARVHFAPKGGDWTIDRIDLQAEAAAPGLTADRLAALAIQAREDSPVAKALGGVFVSLGAQLI